MIISKRVSALLVSGSLALSIGLAGCGAQEVQSNSVATQPAQSTVEETAATTGGSSSASSATESSTQATPAPQETATTQTAPAPQETAAPQATATTEAPAASTANTNGYIDEQEAMNVALNDAGVAQSNCTELSVELDLESDDGDVPHYDVDFKAGGVEYEYKIDPTTGAILMKSSEIDD